MSQNSGLRLDNRSTGLLLGLILVVAAGILVAIYLDSNRDTNPDEQQVATSLDPNTAADVSAQTDAEVAQPAAEATIPAIPDAEPQGQPTSVFVPANGAAAAPAATTADSTVESTTDAATTEAAASASTASTADPAATPDAAALTADFEDGEFDSPPAGTDTSGGTSEPLPEPTARTNDPFAFSGPASFWEDNFNDAGATINKNELDFVINSDGTGSFRGELDVEWPDGRTLLLKIDRDFTWDNGSTNVRATLVGDVEIDGEAVTAGTLAIRKVDDGFGSLCFGDCVSFQYEAPFWSLTPEG